MHSSALSVVEISYFLGLIPMSRAWVLGFPMGMWELAVLKSPPVRTAFETRGRC